MPGTCCSAKRREAAETTHMFTEMAEPFGIVSQDHMNEVRDAHQAASGNANRYVPWDDPQIPYECTCGDIIYSDWPHTHPGDPEPGKMSPEEEDAEYKREHDTLI
jgi:hypothetical protein